MRLTQLFTHTLRFSPKDAVAANHILLIRGGFVAQLSSGIYSFLPLGFRVLKKLEEVIRQELEKIGALEVNMPILHPASLWKKTGRWQEAGKELWKIKDRGNDDLVLSMTHEEPMAEIASHFIKTADDLPRLLNQFQFKFRDEERPRGGLLRLKEFFMQDAYSFDRDEAGLAVTYQKVFNAYQNIFQRLELKVIPVEALSGVMGGNESHEFMLLAEAGEDKVVFCENCRYAANAEAVKSKTCPRCQGKLVERRAIELGHIFKLGTKYSEAFDVYFEDENGQKKLAVMGSYGIGLDRLMAAIVEVSHDEEGIIWPKEAAPFRVHLIALEGGQAEADKLYRQLTEKNAEVLYDDRADKTAGEKFADADLLGCPMRAVVSKKSLAAGGAEVKKRAASEIKIVQLTQLSSFLL